MPGAKLAALALLLATAERRSKWRPRLRARIYRVLDVIGRWSMVDIYVTAIVVALVQFKTLAQVEARARARSPSPRWWSLTMFASMSFDPRLIWDPVDGP